MFEQARAKVQAQIAAAEAGVQQAIAARDAARAEADRLAAELPRWQAALADADGAAAAANAALAAAQAVVDEHQHARGAAQASRDAAQQALSDHAADQPERLVPSGKPHPAWGAWMGQQVRLVAARRHADEALAAADAALAQVREPRDVAAQGAAAAAAAVARASDQLAAANAGVEAAQQRFAAAEQGIAAAQQALADASASVAVWEARARRILAEPLERPDLEQAADAELADALALRRRRHELLGRRAATLAARTGVLSTHDGIVDDLARLRADVVAWPDGARWPALGALVGALDGIIAASGQQRTQPGPARTDDLTGAWSQLDAQLGALDQVGAQAVVDRDMAQTAVDNAAAALRRHQEARA